VRRILLYCCEDRKQLELLPLGLEAHLVKKAEDWRWSSLWVREKESEKQNKLLDPLPTDLPKDYLSSVNEILTKDNLETVRYSVNKGKPFGSESWVARTVKRFKLESTLLGSGRPRTE
jgi:putative transposase